MGSNLTGAETEPATQPRGFPAEPADGRSPDGTATTMPVALYRRTVRVVSYLFIAAVTALVTLTGGTAQNAVYVLLAIGIAFLVVFQDVLAPTSLGRWRLPLEGAATITFLTVLLMLTGGLNSPYFFGYILVLSAGSLWASGAVPPILAAVTVGAYLIVLILSPGPPLLTIHAIGRVGSNLVALGLVAYVAWVIGREHRRAREDALRLSRFDSLTGLFSRAFFVSTLEREIQRAARTGRAFALMMVDLDRLKEANDRFGHESGDRLLQSVAEVLRAHTRVTDVAARYAGDEFVLLLPETDLAGALRVADKLRVDITHVGIRHNGSVIRTSASIGLVTYPEDGRTATELMHRADLAMYEAKRRGRDQVVRYARETASPTGQSGADGQANARATQRAPADVPPATPGVAPWETHDR